MEVGKCHNTVLTRTEVIHQSSQPKLFITNPLEYILKRIEIVARAKKTVMTTNARV